MSGRARRRQPGLHPTGLAKALGGLIVLAVVAGILILVFNGTVHKAYNELTLPLQHEDIIRQQAKEKGIDAALIAAVIDTESKFTDAESSAGARGLMQITPEAAKDIARHSGATSFHTSDLSDPEINIKYGTYLLAERIDFYEGNVAAALASYNAGPGTVEKWGGSEPEGRRNHLSGNARLRRTGARTAEGVPRTSTARSLGTGHGKG